MKVLYVRIVFQGYVALVEFSYYLYYGTNLIKGSYKVQEQQTYRENQNKI